MALSVLFNGITATIYSSTAILHDAFWTHHTAMKRRNSENDGDKSNKRVNLSPDASRAALFDSPQNQRYIGEILRNKEVADMPGYIVGTIYLVYPYQPDKIQIDLHTEDSEIGRNGVHLEVVFGKHCTSRLLRRNMQFSPGKRVFFSLQGGSFVLNGRIPRLKFSKRVMFKMGEGEGMVVIDEWDRKLLLASGSLNIKAP